MYMAFLIKKRIFSIKLVFTKGISVLNTKRQNPTVHKIMDIVSHVQKRFLLFNRELKAEMGTNATGFNSTVDSKIDSISFYGKRTFRVEQ